MAKKRTCLCVKILRHTDVMRKTPDLTSQKALTARMAKYYRTTQLTQGHLWAGAHISKSCQRIPRSEPRPWRKEPQTWKVLMGRWWTIIQPINVLTVKANLEQEHLYESQRPGWKMILLKMFIDYIYFYLFYWRSVVLYSFLTRFCPRRAPKLSPVNFQSLI